MFYLCAPRLSASLRYFPTPLVGPSRRSNFLTPLHGASQGSNYFQAAPIFFNTAPLRFASLQYFPTPLHGASRRYNKFPFRAAPSTSRRTYILSRRSLAPNIPPAAPRPKNPSGCIVHRTPRQFHPCIKIITNIPMGFKIWCQVGGRDKNFKFTAGRWLFYFWFQTCHFFQRI